MKFLGFVFSGALSLMLAVDVRLQREGGAGVGWSAGALVTTRTAAITGDAASSSLPITPALETGSERELIHRLISLLKNKFFDIEFFLV